MNTILYPPKCHWSLNSIHHSVYSLQFLISILYIQKNLLCNCEGILQLSQLWRYVKLYKVCHTYEGMSYLKRYVKFVKVCQMVCQTCDGILYFKGRYVKLVKVCHTYGGMNCLLIIIFNMVNCICAKYSGEQCMIRTKWTLSSFHLYLYPNALFCTQMKIDY